MSLGKDTMHVYSEKKYYNEMLFYLYSSFFNELLGGKITCGS